MSFVRNYALSKFFGKGSSGSGGSGGGSSFGENTVVPNFLNVFYALESGTGVTGEFTLANPLPNTETLIFDSGLSEIKGFFYVDCDYNYEPTAKIIGVWGLYMDYPNRQEDGKNRINQCATSNYSSGNGLYALNNATTFPHCKWRIEGGKLYVTADYNASIDYSPFFANHRIKWVAW